MILAAEEDNTTPLHKVVEFVKRFVSLSNSQTIAITLWVVHTHAVDVAQTTPYLNITSAEKQCGKTVLLEVLRLLVAKPWFTASASKAVLVRKIHSEKPTLLLDESDAAFAGDKEYSEALRGILNCGHSRDGVASLCVGQGANITFKDFEVFCPKAIAGIGRLPDTVADRSIPIRMKRRAPNEKVERFRPRLHKAEADQIRAQVEAWLSPIISSLKEAKPDLPEALSDRQQDGCEPLLAIADAAGLEWRQKARRALVEILTGEAAEDNSVGVRLLSDAKDIFEQKQADSLPTCELLSALCDQNPFWSEFAHGKPLTSASLARLLKRFEVYHQKLRIGDATPWGYQCVAFKDAWNRYLRHKLEQVEQRSNDAEKVHFADLEHGMDVPGRKSEESPVNTRLVPDVPASEREVARKDDYLFDAAVGFCRQKGRASVSEIMRALGIPRAEAVRYVDDMEQRGLVPPAKGAGPRPFSPPTAVDLGFDNPLK